MPFDPTQPATGAPLSSELMRDQLNGLRAETESAIGTTARNPGNVSSLGLSISDPPTQAEVQAIAAKVDELLAALFRAP
jgi:hypothetical protein